MAGSEAFKPVDVNRLDSFTRGRHVQNIVESAGAANYHERQAGSRFYGLAHSDALKVGLGLDPGVMPYGKAAGPAGQRREGGVRRLPPEVRDHLKANPGARDEAVRRGAGAIAALSPSSPAGMDWEHNARAAYEVQQLPDEAIGKFRAADEKLGDVSKAVGALRSAKKTGQGLPEATKALGDARDAYTPAADAARAHLAGTPALRRAGGKAIIKAHEILSGQTTPEEALPMDNKTGHFYENIRHPGNPGPATVDGRSHDIALGQHLPWDTNRGLSAKGRYSYFVDAHQQARDVLHMRTANQVQATSWIHDKNAMLAKASPGEQRLGRSGNRAGTEGQE